MSDELLFVPFSPGYLKFWHAILIDLGSLLVVVLNGTKLLRYRVFESASATGAGAAKDDSASALKGSATTAESRTAYNPIQQA